MASEEASLARRSELRTRIASAAILAPVALIAEILGGLVFAALVVLVAVIAYWEWVSISGAEELSWPRAVWLMLLVAGLFGIATVDTDWRVALVGGPVILAGLAGLLFSGTRWTSFGFVYVALPAAGLVILRDAQPSGWAAILFILIVVWATDIAAFFGGRAIGGPKFWPRLSPKKTWSGAVCGLAAAMVAGGLTAILTGAGGFPLGFLLALPLAIAAEAGDLFESAVKRRFAVKDSGSIIPGHGGVLDRIDGLLGAAALAWLLATLGLGGSLLALPAQVRPPREAPHEARDAAWRHGIGRHQRRRRDRRGARPLPGACRGRRIEYRQACRSRAQAARAPRRGRGR